MSTVVRAVSISESDINDVHQFPTQEEADAFCEGFGAGAGCYGAGTAFAVTLENVDEYYASGTWRPEQYAEVRRRLTEG